MTYFMDQDPRNTPFESSYDVFPSVPKFTTVEMVKTSALPAKQNKGTVNVDLLLEVIL
jgi:hypothetical protein